MQPDDRMKGDEIPSQLDQLDWGPLKVAFGKHGLWPVVLTLFWWGHLSNSDGARTANPENWLNWKLACGDFSWAMWSLVENGLVPLEKRHKLKKAADAKLKGKWLAVAQGIVAPSAKQCRTDSGPTTSMSTSTSTAVPAHVQPKPHLHCSGRKKVLSIPFCQSNITQIVP